MYGEEQVGIWGGTGRYLGRDRAGPAYLPGVTLPPPDAKDEPEKLPGVWLGIGG